MPARKGWLYRHWIDVKPRTSSKEDGRWGGSRLIGLSKDSLEDDKAGCMGSQDRVRTASRQCTRYQAAR